MDEQYKEKILEKIVELNDFVKADPNFDKERQSIENIIYCRDFTFKGSGLAQENTYMVQIKNQNEEGKNNVKSKGEKIDEYLTYSIYDENYNLIATVDKDGKIEFDEAYLEGLKEISGDYFKTLQLDNLEFELPEQLGEKDLIVSKEEIQEQKEKTNEKKKDVEQETEEEKQEKTAQALGVKKEDLGKVSTINPNKKITQNDTLANIMPEATQYEEIQMAEKRTDGKTVGLGIKKDGTREELKSLEDIGGTSTEKVISVNEDGSEVEEKSMRGLKRINARGRDAGIAISKESDGRQTIGYVSNVNDKEHRRATPVETGERTKRPSATVLENAADSKEEMEKEGEIYRKKKEAGIDPQSIDGIDIDESDGKISLDQLEEKVIEDIMNQEDVGEMSRGEILEEIEGRISEEGLEITQEEHEKLKQEIYQEVSDRNRTDGLVRH